MLLDARVGACQPCRCIIGKRIAEGIEASELALIEDVASGDSFKEGKSQEHYLDF
jgi:hypothetical protein